MEVMEVNQQLYCAVASGIRKWSGLGCTPRVHKYNSQLHDGRAVNKEVQQDKDVWEKVRRVKQVRV